MIGRITAEPFIETVKNGDAQALFVQVSLSQSGEVRTVQFFPGAGEETWPCKGDVVVVERKGGFLYASAVWDKAKPKLQPGERELYSRKPSREKAASILLDNDGNINLNGNKKRFVTYAELNKELQRIWATIQGHTHTVVDSTATPSPALGSTTLDISESETKTIKTGG